MQPHIVNDSPRYTPPAFEPPPPWGYLYVGAAVAPPAGPPFVRPDARRRALLAQLKRLSHELEQLDAVRDMSVFRAVLVPPVRPGTGRPARYDVAVLIETTSPDAIAEVRASDAYGHLIEAIANATSDVLSMSARCVRNYGEVDHHGPGLFLFNHFVAASARTHAAAGTETGTEAALTAATGLWEHLLAWYARETGLDNSTLLAPLTAGDYVLVNHARWDKGVLRLAVEQFGKKSFRSYVRANLRANGMIAMPVLYRAA